MKKSILLLIILFVLSLITSHLVKAKESGYTDTPIPQILRGSGSNLSNLDRKNYQGGNNLPPVSINPYKDNNEKLFAVMGKTQLIKFDEPVKRISITDPSLADLILLSPKELLLNGKKTGRTSLIFWGESDKPVFFNLIVQQDTDAVMQAIEKVAPGEDVSFSHTDDGIILSGHVSSTAVKKQIDEIIKAYKIDLVDLTESPTKQVLLEVKITEASRNFTKTLQSGFKVGDDGSVYLTRKYGTFDGKDFNYYLSYSPDNLAWQLKASEEKGLIKILAEPKLLAMDGQSGSFSVGQDIPYPAAMGMSNTPTYEFRTTGVILNFTPTILEKSNRVVLKLSPEVSEIDKSYTSTALNAPPAFKTRKIDTTVELADGETLIIAGLLKHNTTTQDTQIPVLGDLPVIGFLFGSKTRNKDDTELVIFITPKIVDAQQTNTGMEL